jgi:hypothetical protein
MSFMTMLAGSLLAGFAVGGFVWLTWSIVERVRARKRDATDTGEKSAAGPGKSVPDKKANAKAGSK